MASKKEIFETVQAQVAELTAKYKTPKEFSEALNGIIVDSLAPKSGGASVNIDEVTKKDADGNITHILCSVSGKFLPATKEYFYEDKAGKGINGLKRLSRQAEAIRKQFTKVINTSEKAVMADVLDGEMTVDEGKAKLQELKAQKPDYSGVTE